MTIQARSGCSNMRRVPSCLSLTRQLRSEAAEGQKLPRRFVWAEKKYLVWRLDLAESNVSVDTKNDIFDR